MIPSKYQVSIYDRIENTNDNIAICATAGSGKTTTIVEAAKRVIIKNRRIDALFLAFNRSIVDELKVRLNESIACRTIHSLGMSCLTKHFRCKLKLDEFKVFRFANYIVKERSLDLNEKQKIILCYIVSDIINLMRLTLSNNTEEDILSLIKFYDIDAGKLEIDIAIETFNKLNEYNQKIYSKNNLIDYTDMVYLPATNEQMILPRFDIIFIDEIQDFNRAQHKFVDRIKKLNGRVIGVGDKRQAIYSFAGADIQSFERFENANNTVSLPLTVSYRCPKNIVLNAQKIFNDIEPYENAKEGIVRQGTIDEMRPGDMVICRNNKPLVVLFLQLLRMNVKSFIKGSDIENGILKLVAKIIDFDKVSGMILLDEQLEKLENELRQNGIKTPKANNKYRSLKEKVEIIKLVAYDCLHMTDVEKKVKFLFENRENAIELMTVHKSKGLENERVFFIERFNNKKLIPSEHATQEWEKIQEMNLLFVALTRSKNELIYLNLVE